MSSNKVIIEPVLAMFVGVFMPCQILISEAVYAALAGHSQLTLEQTTADNASTGGTCSTSADQNRTADVDDVGDVEAYVQSESAHLLTLFDVCSQVPALVSVVMYGAYSDVIGRKLPIVLPLLGQLVKCSLYMIILRYRLSLYIMVTVSLLEGLSGSLPTMLMSCYAYLTRICPLDKRTLRLNVIDVLSGMSGSVGQILIGLAISYTGYIWPFMIIMAVHVVNLIYVLLCIPEQKNDQRTSSFTQQLTRGLRLYTTDDDHGKVWQRWLLLVAELCCNGVMSTRWVPITLYTMNSPLCWSSVLLGIYVAWTSLCSQIGQIVLAVILQHKLHDDGLAILGCAFSMAYFLSLAFCTTTWSMFLCTLFSSGGFLPFIMLRVINSKLTPGDSQGSMFSILTIIDITCQLTAGVVFNTIYGATQLIMSGFVFIVMSAIQCFGMTFIIIYSVKSKKAHRQEQFITEGQKMTYKSLA